MTRHALNNVIMKYQKLLAEHGALPHKQGDAAFGPETRLEHAHWMLMQMGVMELEKAFRWLGFVQGVMWCVGFRTIEEMREDNRSAEAAHDQT